MDLLEKLSEMPGAAGREERVREFIQDCVRDHVDEMRVDAMGNLICKKSGSSATPKRVMLSCHMDEIAFYVRSVDKDGFLRLHALGGFDTRNLFARRVRVQTRKGGDIEGTLNPSGPPIHTATDEERKKIPKIHEFFVDTGRSADEVKEMVRPGDPVTLIQSFQRMGDLVSGKAMDNRVACWLGIRVLERLSQPEDDVYVVFTVQEEIGLRGAITSSYGVDPDIGIAVDVTLAVDLPGVSAEERITQLGEGVAIKVLDGSSVSDNALVEEFVALAEKHEIKHQYEVLPFGGTDAGALQRARAGAKVITISVPTRYVHTITETIHPADLHAALDLLHAYLERG